MKPAATRTTLIILGFVLAAGLGGAGGYWIGHSHPAASASGEVEKPDAAETDDDKPVVTVETMRLKLTAIPRVLTAYGVVATQGGDVRAVSAPFEARVVRVMATPNQEIAAGAELVEVEASPDVKVALQEARNAVETAKRELKQAEQRFESHLATNQDLSAAQQAVQSANLKLDSMVQRGVEKPLVIKAEAAGVVNKVNMQAGQIVPAGTALLEIAAQSHIEARLGMEPAEAAALQKGQKVELRRTSGGADAPAIQGTVHTVGRRLDPSTRLVEVLVALPPDSGLILDTFVVGTVDLGPVKGFMAPRNAALADEDGKFQVFTVQGGKARPHEVTLGVRSGEEAQIIGEGLKEGDVLVVKGNEELEDGMKVEVEQEEKVQGGEKADAAEEGEKH